MKRVIDYKKLDPPVYQINQWMYLSWPRVTVCIAAVYVVKLAILGLSDGDSHAVRF